jgi:hypothetical protein
MSMVAIEDVPCPDCGSTTATRVWSSINSMLDPGFRQMLLDGEINRFRCKACGFEALINTSLLYNDQERGFCVHYFPPEEIEEDGLLDYFERAFPLKIALGGSMAGGETMYMFRPHVVFDMGEMLRCVMFYEKLLGGEAGSA